MQHKALKNAKIKSSSQIFSVENANQYLSGSNRQQIVKIKILDVIFDN